MGIQERIKGARLRGLWHKPNVHSFFFEENKVFLKALEENKVEDSAEFWDRDGIEIAPVI